MMPTAGATARSNHHPGTLTGGPSGTGSPPSIATRASTVPAPGSTTSSRSTTSAPVHTGPGRVVTVGTPPCSATTAKPPAPSLAETVRVT